jgi:formylglycine-generating enzyme required for sulfatase activity
MHGPPHPPPMREKAAAMHIALDRTTSLVLPAALLAALLGTLALQSGALPQFATTGMTGPQTATIAPRSFSYRATGDFVRDGAPVDGPVLTVDNPAPVEIMTFPVSETEYATCVADGACKAAEPRRRGVGNVPVTGVSFRDATDYANWLSMQTGATWRLPTVAEWDFAAGSKARDHALGRETDASDPAERWLAFYEKEAALGANALATPQPIGSGGVNEYGVADLGGAVWEWTATCGSRTVMDAAGATVSYLDSCGVRMLEGRHRTPMSNFIRDAQGGGCNAGVPPDNLGFRLVREPGPFAFLGWR